MVADMDEVGDGECGVLDELQWTGRSGDRRSRAAVDMREPSIGEEAGCGGWRRWWTEWTEWTVWAAMVWWKREP